jgi:hypothetical protein
MTKHRILWKMENTWPEELAYKHVSGTLGLPLDTPIVGEPITYATNPGSISGCWKFGQDIPRSMGSWGERSLYTDIPIQRCSIGVNENEQAVYAGTTFFAYVLVDAFGNEIVEDIVENSAEVLIPQ